MSIKALEPTEAQMQARVRLAAYEAQGAVTLWGIRRALFGISKMHVRQVFPGWWECTFEQGGVPRTAYGLTPKNAWDWARAQFLGHAPPGATRNACAA